MARARNPVSREMPLSYDPATEKYKTSEAGINYYLPYSLLDSLKRGFRNCGGVEGWYLQLSKEDRKLVYREGLPNNTTEYCDGDFIE